MYTGDKIKPVDEVKDLPDPDEGLSDEEKAKIEKRLLRKLDFTLIPWLCILYLLAFLDRANIGNAKIAGLTHDLGLTTAQFNATLTIFFVSYSVFEPLTNVLLKKMRPSIFIPLIMVIWGIIMTFMGFVHNYTGLMVARWFLGLAEAGLFPGINYYLSCWYRRSEFGIRAALFFSAAAISGSFGGLLAAAIEQMAGVGGKPGWAWIFILEGLVTVLFGIASFWFVYDFPSEAKFLSPEDRARVIRRLRSDKQAIAEKEHFAWGYVWSSVTDWKMWIGAAIYSGITVPLYSFSIFLPTIIHDLGWSETIVEAQLYSVPPYVAAAILTVVVGWLADRTRTRGIYNIGSSVLASVGFIMLLATHHPAVAYCGTFLGALGIYPCISNTITWVANNTEGVYRRGVILGFVIGWGNLCGIVSSNIYFSPPYYAEGHGVVLGFLVVFLMGGSMAMTVLLRIENRRRSHGERDIWVEGKSEQEIRDLGDWRPDFVYTT
ncbi:major facilitator superfamily domain-containing protein [Echria macrotheca]|uniref:Major facilitator superfamily domain-containing protein n=1 Tax=Echria macrotheca TaxID=438768 RepID=A0AAJ0B2J3_9PEZI|nr:major facilitator superfamily domain-containing protein [Echria macrotheca]